jgi:hypothetical protein
MKRLNIFAIQISLVLLVQIAFGQVEKDTLNSIQQSEVSSNQSLIPQVLFSGLLYRNTDKKRVWYIPNAFEQFPANTVEGFVLNPQIKFTQKFSGKKFISLRPNLRYGFGNARFQAKISSLFFIAPKRKATIAVSGGRGVEQLYAESTLSSFNNLVYTFLLRENFLKIFERTFLEVGGTIAPINNFFLSSTLSWNQRSPLANLPKYENEEVYTSNDPKNIELPSTHFEENTSVILEASLRWQIGHSLEKQRGELVSAGRYPAITIAYSGALRDVANSDNSFHKLSLQVEDHFHLGNTEGHVFFEMGDFISKDELTFIDFNHFKGKQTVYGEYGVDQFQLLNYYNFSTANFYFQGHYQHQFASLKQTGKSRFQPLIGLNYLYTESGGIYGEIGVGMAQILDIWRIDFYTGLREGGDSTVGVRLGVNFNYFSEKTNNNEAIRKQ